MPHPEAAKLIQPTVHLLHFNSVYFSVYLMHTEHYWQQLLQTQKRTSFAIDGQQHSSGIPNVPVISSGCEGGSLVTTAELEL